MQVLVTTILPAAGTRCWRSRLGLHLTLLLLASVLTGCSYTVPPAANRQVRQTVRPEFAWHDAAHPAPTQLPAGAPTGIMVVSVRAQEAPLAIRSLPQNTDSVEIVLSSTQLETPFRLMLESGQLVNGQAIFSVSGLPPGSYELSVAARDAAGTLLATAQSTLTITTMAVLPVDLLLAPPPGSSGSGALAIRIDTPVTVSPTTAYPKGTVAATVS